MHKIQKMPACLKQRLFYRAVNAGQDKLNRQEWKQLSYYPVHSICAEELCDQLRL